MPEPHGQDKVEQDPLELNVGWLQKGVSLSTRVLSLDESDETSDAFPTRGGPPGNKLEDGLSFLSVKNTIGTYPDTGESGDAYDAEAFVDC